MQRRLPDESQPHRPAPDREQIVPLQFLRGVAASGVVAEHLLERYSKRGAFPDGLPEFATRFGAIGVSAFFAISGFIMVYISLRNRGRPTSGRDFFRSRFLRVAPLYYLTTVASILFIWMTLSLSTRTSYHFPTIAELVQSFLFIPHRNSASGLIQPVYSLGWTLHYEMFFYLLFAGGLTLGARRGAYAVIAILAALAAAGTMLDAPSDDWGLSLIIYVFTRPLMLYFGVGMLIAMIRESVAERLPTLPAPVIAALALLALGASAFAPTAAGIFAAIAAALAVTVLVRPADAERPGAFSAFSRAFGDASFSIYLTHSFLLGAFALATTAIAAQSAAALVATILFGCLVCFAGGWLTWRFVEIPISNWLRRERPSRAEMVAP